MISPADKHIPELDGVRGLACGGVLMAHCFLGIMVVPEGSIQQWLWSSLQYFLLGGVDLFFVLSGFLIGGILVDNKDASNFFTAFWVRRVGRILPVLYMLLLSYSLILHLQQAYDLSFLHVDLWVLKEPVHSPWLYAAFLQSIPFASADWGPRWTAVTWSLAIEEQFYFFFPVIVYFFSRKNLTVAVISAALFAPLLRSFVVYKYGWTPGYVLLPCRMDALAIGVLITLLIRHDASLTLAKKYRGVLDVVILGLAILIGKNQSDQWSVELGGAGITYAGSAVQTLIYSQVALFFALCILRLFLYERGAYHRLLTWRPLMWLGLISYGLYMYHQAVNGILHGWLFASEPRVESLAQGMLALGVMALAIALAAASYYCVEAPIRRLAQRVRFQRVDVVGEHRSATSRQANPMNAG
jgi:peptidoglycan/LPS O-acetylase OafA/YrhL